MAITLSVDQLTADTQELYLRTVEDQVHDRIPIVHKMRKMKRVVTKGGRNVVKPLRYAKNTQTQSYGKAEPLDSGTESKRTAAKFAWKYTQTPIKYDVEDEILNDGENQIVDTIAEEVKSAQEDQMDTLSENFFAVYDKAGTVSTPGSNDPLSLNAGICHDPTYGGLATYGGITRGVGDWFTGRTGNDSAQAFTTVVSVSFNQWDYMVDQVLTKRGNRKSLLAVCGSVLFRKWKSLVRAKERELDTSGMMAKAGFASFTIDGVEIVLDDNCPASYFYMLDLSTWEWRISPKRNFEVTKFVWQGQVNNGLDEYLARVKLAHTGLICWKPANNYMTTAMS